MLMTLLAGLAQAEGVAEDQVFSLDIPAMEAESAIKSLARQTGYSVLFRSADVAGIKTNAIDGSYTLTDVLPVLFRETGLNGHLTRRGVITIFHKPAGGVGKVTMKNSKGLFWDKLAAALASVLVVHPAVSADDTKSLQGGLEEIIVTARRKEESLQSVPVSIVSLNQADLEERGIDSAMELTNFVPSLVVSSAGSQGTNFTIRGQGSTFYAGPGVVVYFAEVPLPGRGVMPGIYHDLQNVEVLKGPQGTLFGRNTTGGAVLFEPAHPTDEREGSIEGIVGSHDWYQMRGMLNVPLIEDRLLARVALDTNQRDGYIDDVNTGRDYNNVDYQSLRIGLTARLSDTLENYTVFQAIDSKSNGTGNLLTDVAPSMAPFMGGYLNAQKARDDDKIALGPTVPDSRIKIIGGVNKTSWEFAQNLTLKNIVSYYEVESFIVEDFDATPLPLIESRRPDDWNESRRNVTEELQLQGMSFDDSLDWIIGGYYEKSEPINGKSGNRTATSVFYVQNDGYTIPEQESYAVYGQGTYDLGHSFPSLENVHFTAGVRHTWDEPEFFAYGVSSTGRCSSSVVSPTPYPDCFVSGNSDSDETTWTLSLDYQWTPDVLVYITSRSGYKQGGINPTAPLDLQQFDPEDVIDYELGLKSQHSYGDTQIRFNAAVFHIDYSDAQKVLSRPPASSATLNAADATLDGIELESVIVPNEYFEFTVNYAYTEGEFEDFINPYTGLDLSDMRYPLIPDHKVTLIGKVYFPVDPSVGDLSLSSTYTYQTSMNMQQAGLPAPGDTIGSYGLLNLNLGWKRIYGSAVDASLFVTNATDEDYFIGRFTAYSSIGYAYAYQGEPRMYGATLKYNF